MTPDETRAAIARLSAMTAAERTRAREEFLRTRGAARVTTRGLFAIVRQVLGTVGLVKRGQDTRLDAIERRVAAVEARPAMKYCGVFADDGRTYGPGDCVTWGGSVWIAKETTRAKPDELTAGGRTWQLAVKRGREGRPGKDGKS